METGPLDQLVLCEGDGKDGESKDYLNQFPGQFVPSHTNHPLPLVLSLATTGNATLVTLPPPLDSIQGPKQSFQVRQRFTCTSSNLMGGGGGGVGGYGGWWGWE